MEHKQGNTTLNIILSVVAVVMLAAILFPVVFPPHRGRGRRSSCQHNMKECVIALHIYTTEYDGYLPSSASVSGSEEWKKEDFLLFATKRGKLPAPSGAHPRTWPQLITKYLKYNDTMFCPSDPADTQSPDAQVSYWWKLAIDKAWYGEDCSKAYRKLDDITYNADCIILYEHEGWHFGSDEGLKNGVQINCAFFDSHVKTLTITNATSGDPINCAANSDGSPMYFNFDNQRRRGSDNPPRESVPATYVDPGRYSDWLR